MFCHKLEILSIIFLLFISAVQVKGLQCLFCTDVVLPTDCDTVLTCAVHEACFVDTIVSGTGKIRFRLGCRDTRQCTNQHLLGKRALEFNHSPSTNASSGVFLKTNPTLKSRSGNILLRDYHHNERLLPGRSAEMLVCSECCSSTLCNNAGCGSRGYPVQRGPVCSNCKYQNGTEDCDKITVCGMDQVCKLARTTDPVLHQTRYNTGCENEAVCHDELQKFQEIAHVFIGRRDTFKVGGVCFIKCCKSDLCNFNCDMTPPTSTTPRLLPTAPTTTSSFTSHSTSTSPMLSSQTEYCLSNPCQRGTCSEYHNTYKCTCSFGFWGRNCEYAPLIQWSTDTTLRLPPAAATTAAATTTTTTTTSASSKTPVTTQALPRCPNLGNGCVASCVFMDRNGCLSCGCSDCYDIYKLYRRSGTHQIYIWNTHVNIEVYCDMDTDGGGWTVFQRRFDGSVNFYRDHDNYTSGFGDIKGEFWLGLEYMYEMLLQGKSELRIDVSAADGSTAYEVYKNFSLSPGPGYTLHIGQASGTAGDDQWALRANNGFNFSTYDHNSVGNFYGGYPDSDNPAISYHGGFWYHHNSAYINLNGPYLTPGTDTGFHGMVYYFYKSTQSLKTSKMMFRRI